MIDKRLTAIEKLFSQFRVSSGDGVQVHGSLHVGLAINTDAGGGGDGSAFSAGLFGCTDPAADNFNPAATVEDGSCAYSEVMGCTDPSACNYNPAATQDDGSCSYDVPSVSLICESISASKSKCGFAAFDGSGGHYLTKTYTETDFWSCSSECSFCLANGFNPGSQIDVSCNIVHTTDPLTCLQSTTGCCTQTTTSCDGTPATITYVAEHSSWSIILATHREGSASFTITGGCLDHPCPSAYSEVYAQDLSDEYTTDVLKSTTVDALPEYDGSFSGAGCTASATLAEDESSYSISRFQYKFTFAAGAAFTITWNEHFEPDDGSPSDTPMSTNISAGQSESSVFEATEPDSNGTVTITGIATSC